MRCCISRVDDVEDMFAKGQDADGVQALYTKSHIIMGISTHS
jgi:hypothetical protein